MMDEYKNIGQFRINLYAERSALIKKGSGPGVARRSNFPVGFRDIGAH
jgi:hypothetical protein